MTKLVFLLIALVLLELCVARRGHRQDRRGRGRGRQHDQRRRGWRHHMWDWDGDSSEESDGWGRHWMDRLVVSISWNFNRFKSNFVLNEPAHEIMALFVLRKLILQSRMRSHPVGLDVWFLVGPFVYFHTSCMRTAKALARLRGCAGSPEPSLVVCLMNTIISWAGSNIFLYYLRYQ